MQFEHQKITSYMLLEKKTRYMIEGHLISRFFVKVAMEKFYQLAIDSTKLDHISPIMKHKCTSKYWHQLNFQNWWVFHVLFSMLFWYWIDVTSQLLDVTLTLAPIFSLEIFCSTTYSKLNLNFELVFGRCNFDVELTWRSIIIWCWNHIHCYIWFVVT